MCRSIKTLNNLDPPANDAEIRAAALQYVRKIGGFREPSAANRGAFQHAVDAIADASADLLRSLVTSAQPKDREVEAAKARARRVAADHPGLLQLGGRPGRAQAADAGDVSAGGRRAQIGVVPDVARDITPRSSPAPPGRLAPA